MATNETDYSYVKSVATSSPTTPASGDPVRFGSATGVALTAKGDGGNASTKTSVDFGPRSWNLSVKGIDDNGNSAVAAGDPIFYVDADTPHLSKKSSGYFFGFAMAAVSSGATATIEVFHSPSPGSGTLGSGTVGTTNLAAGAVTAAKLGATLDTGFVAIPLASFRIIATNDISAHGTADGGVVSLDTDPTFKRVNGATDKQLRIAWAASSVVEIAASFPLPPDYDNASPVLLNLLLGMGGATDTPVVAVSAFAGVGGSNLGGNTTALAATVAKKTISLAGASVGAYPGEVAIGLVPGTHTTDAVYLYAAWVEYTRK